MNLIYLICYWNNDPMWVEMTTMCVTSLRKLGNYKDKIVIMTDHNQAFMSCDLGDNTEVLNVSSNEIIETSNHRNGAECFYVAKQKFYKFFDVSPFNKVLYLDSDILVINDIHPLFNISEDFHYAREYLPMNSPWFNGCLDEDEKEQANWVRGANAGTFCVPSNMFSSYMQLWLRSICEFPSAVAYDQPVLNALIFRNKISAKPFADYTVAFPQQQTFSHQLRKQTSILHYAGNKNRAVTMMKQHYKELFTFGCLQSV